MELTPGLEQRIIAFAQEWAKNTFHVREAKAHISRDEHSHPQEGGQDWEEEGYLTGYEVCLDMPTFGDIRNTVVVVSSTGRLEIDDSAGGDQGCAVCDHGHIREYLPESEVNSDTTHRELMECWAWSNQTQESENRYAERYHSQIGRSYLSLGRRATLDRLWRAAVGYQESRCAATG